MNDKDLDILFAQSAQRRKAVEQINMQVMRSVRRDMRIKALRKWAKLLGICFGLPLMAVLYVYILFTYMPEMDAPLRIMTFVLPLGTLALFFGKGLHDFSFMDL